MDFVVFAACFLSVCIVWFIILMIIRKKDAQQISYDERQLIARNRAYKYAFFVLMLYFAVMELIDIIGAFEYYWAPESNLGVGLFLSLGTFVVISIFQDAYIPSGKGKTKTSLFTFALLGIYQLYIGISKVIENGGILFDGQINIPVSLSIGILFIVVCMAQLLKLAIDYKSAKEEE